MSDSETNSAPETEAVDGAGPQSPEALMAAAEARAAEHYANYVRVLAEFDNFRKRASRELDHARQFAVERFAQELLPAMDGFELALANQGADLAAVLEGQGATLRLLQKAFEKAGIKELAPAAGSPFNPEEHEAMVAQPTADVSPGAVLTTIQKGYALNGRVLRAARVIVARALDA